ncbi:MAG: acyl-CoA dehydrogenase family protein, partial [Cyanobacteria bacterium P01_H01_bin.150]
ATGRELAGFAITEAVAGSNPRAIATTALPDSQGWRLNGQKSWIGHGSWAGTINVFAQMLDANHQPIGISGFVVRQGTFGLRQGPEALTMGMRGMVQNSIYLEDVPVTASNLLGEQGSGIEVAQDAMMFGRLGLGVMSLGAMKRCAQLMLRYSQRRLISTGRLLDNSVTLVRLNNLTLAITALETLVFTIADLLDRGEYIPEEAYTACKTSGPEFLGEAADQLVQLLGGRGYIETNIAPQILRDARLLRIFEGPTETLNMFLGSRAINKGEELHKFLSEGLGMTEVAQRLKATTEKINQHIKSSGSLFSNQNKAVSWIYFLTGELTTFAILMATVKRAFDNNASEDLRHTLSWVELKFEQKLKSIISEITSTLVLENHDTLITQIPDADTITARIYHYGKAIGDLEQTLPGEDYELDDLLKRKTSKSESGTDTAIEIKNDEYTIKYREKFDAKSKNKNITYDATLIENLIKKTLAKKLNIDVNYIKSQAKFVSYGIDSVMAVELIQDLENCLNKPLEATLLWNFP